VDEDGIKLTSYFGERRRIDGEFVGNALVDLYRQREVAASILLRGAEGFGLKHHIRTNHSLTLSEDLPLTAIAVDTSARIKAVLDETRRINHRGLITMERTRFLSDEIGPLARVETSSEAAKLTVYFSRQDTVYLVPAFEVMCELLHRRSIDGATTLAGVDGATHGHRQRAHLFTRNADVPMMVVAVGEKKVIGAILPEIADLLREPRMTLERVQVCKRDGQLIDEPGTPPPYDDDGVTLWQKLTVYTSADARHDGQPIHRVLIRRLRSAGISGATTQPGIWGYHGRHVPHGDQHLIQLGRHVPAVTSVLDAPRRISTAFSIINELTAERGLVTCENVPILPPEVSDQPHG
jgi:PII-like signaling protein